MSERPPGDPGEPGERKPRRRPTGGRIPLARLDHEGSAPVPSEDALSGHIFDPDLAAGAFEDDDFDAPSGEFTWAEESEPGERGARLRADLPPDPGEDDLDPVTALFDELPADEEEPVEPAAVQGERRPAVRNVVGVKFQPAGKIYLYEGADDVYRRGEEVVVESDRGPRIGVVAVDSVRRAQSRASLKRILRRPAENDRRSEEKNQERAGAALALARKQAREHGLAIKLFRAEYNLAASRVTFYYSADGKVDHRGLARTLGQELSGRVDLRQTGVRDEAKMVGGIGSCGETLCCSTWLPAFVPVSIRNAKDQGLVLNPAKVSGQCGRLKCCLVYEQELYAELRKGMPKLGKRVLTVDGGEGRVVEVDVLHQRVRVSLSGGEFRVYAGSDVKPMFPSSDGRPEGDASGADES